MTDCVFCQITAGEIPSEKVLENEEFLAFLSITPVYDGLTVIIPKKHFDSYAYTSMPQEIFSRWHLFAKETALLLDKKLGSERCIQVMEGLGVNHAHIKLFPKYKGVTHAMIESQITIDRERIRKIGEKLRK